MNIIGHSLSRSAAAGLQPVKATQAASCVARGRRKVFEALLALSFTMLGSSCASDTTRAPERTNALCTPFDTQECLGAGACKGGQMCQSDGLGWSACDCGSTSISDASADASSDAISVACSGNLKVHTNTCEDTGAVVVGTGKYWINSNVWGRPSDDTSSQQCSWLKCLAEANLAWGTSWNWTGDGNSVKAYPSVVLGWHWGLRVVNTGLPVLLSEKHAINTGWDFTVSQSGSLDVSYDLWIHTIPHPDSSGTGANGPSDEVMIWLYRAGSVMPAGSPVAQSVAIAGTTWDLWEGPIQGWTTHSFVRTTNTESATLNIGDFLDYLVTERGLDNSKYLTSIESGTEVFVGVGELDTNSYYCTVQ